MNGEPTIKPLPSVNDIKSMAETLVQPEWGYNDTAAKAYIDTVFAIANTEDEYQSRLANEAARHAFTKTEAFEKAFCDFAGRPAPMQFVQTITAEETDRVS